MAQPYQSYYGQAPIQQPPVAVFQPNDPYPVIYDEQVKKALTGIVHSTLPYIKKNDYANDPGYRSYRESNDSLLGRAVTSLAYMPTTIQFGNNYNGGWNTFNTTNNYNERNPRQTTREEPKKQENQTNYLALAIFGGIGLVFAYFIGRSIQEKTNADQDLRNVDTLSRYTFQEIHESSSMAFSDPQALNKQLSFLSRVTSDGKKLFEAKKRDANINLALRTAMLGSAIIGAWGALAAIPAMVTAGAVATVATLMFMLIKAGMNSNDDEKAQLARDIKNNADRLLNVIRSIPEINAQQPVHKFRLVNLMASAPMQGQ